MPGDTRTHIARQAKKRRKIRKAGDLEAARRKLWQAITSAEDVLLAPDTDRQTVLRAVHAISQATATYAKLLEVDELEARMSELEKSVASSNGKAAT